MAPASEHSRIRLVVAIGFCLVGIAVIVAAVTLWKGRVEQTSGPMPHHAYVWQRSWSDDVRRGLDRTAGRTAGFVVLAAEVDLAGGRPKISRVAVDHKALARTGRPVGLALRIGPYAGPFRSDDPVARTLLSLATSMLAQAQAGGLRPGELQIDFDCAEAKLDGYRVWVQALRSTVAPTPVTITALPSWLDRRAFRRLVEAADGYVLQLHSLEKPAGPNQPLSLCSPARARAFVEAAARIGLPFQVALPTYGYIVAFDAQGRFVGLSAQGSIRAPQGGTLRAVRADPAAMAQLVRTWTQSRPVHLQGIIWYRMPVPGEVLNWRWATLVEVMAGRQPAAMLKAAARKTAPGLAEIELQNTGNADAPLAVAVEATWETADLVAADALAGFEPDHAAPRKFAFRPLPAAKLQVLPPGEKRLIGWLRLSTDTEVNVNVMQTKD